MVDQARYLLYYLPIRRVACERNLHTRREDSDFETFDSMEWVAASEHRCLIGKMKGEGSASALLDTATV